MGIISNVFYILTLTLAGSLGGLFFKRASANGLSLNRTLFSNLAIGGTCYLIGAGLNIYVLTQLPYSIVYPLTSLTYVWTFILSYLFLHENITVKKVMGLLFIFLGSVLLIG
ncbi:EamA family transporter [Oceanobacillus senegalensis]|uniref:EamA family transporter n=1 Tax=Oceanobacillus senegalensis TaxID=1936063 RepID=UPI000A306E39|nr:EamA family transporter [Oceanobacillus senegalensis]